MLGQVRLFMAQQTSEKSRREYSQGISGLQQWLQGAEEALRTKPECDHTKLREYVTHLDVSIPQGLCIYTSCDQFNKVARSKFVL